MNKWNTLNRKPDPISNNNGIDDYIVTNAGLTQAYVWNDSIRLDLNGSVTDDKHIALDTPKGESQRTTSSCMTVQANQVDTIGQEISNQEDNVLHVILNPNASLMNENQSSTSKQCLFDNLPPKGGRRPSIQ